MTFKNEQSPPGIHLLKADDLQTWFLSIEVLGDSVYKGQVFALKFVFEPNYPIEAPQVSLWLRFSCYVSSHLHLPQVTFFSGSIGSQYFPNPPLHPHVYSNGHICISTLGV